MFPARGDEPLALFGLAGKVGNVPRTRGDEPKVGWRMVRHRDRGVWFYLGFELGFEMSALGWPHGGYA